MGRMLIPVVLAFMLLMLPHSIHAQDGIPTIEIQVDGYEVVGFNPFSERKTRRLLKKYRGTSTDLQTVRQAAARLEEELRDEGYTLMEVIVPPQPVSNRIITLETTGFMISEINVSGNRHFRDDNILRSVPGLEVGSAPNTRKLDRALEVANKHPSKRTNLQFLSRSAEDTGVVTTLNVTDQKPWQVFGWTNNTGTEETGEWRIGAGYQYSNLFNRDHTTTLTYTTSPDEPDNVEQYGISYRIPVYRTGGILNFLWADSEIDTGQVGGGFNITGKGEIWGGSYTQHLYKRGSYGHSLVFGYVDTLYDNDVEFSGAPIGTKVRARPLGLRYQNEWSGGQWRYTTYLEPAANLSGGSFNDSLSYAASRAGADEDWWRVRYGFSIKRPINRWRFEAIFHGQHADEPLIPGEQFGLGGLGSVRGFEQREITGDSAQFLSLNLWTPPWRGLKMSVFVDGGAAQRENPLPGEVDDETLLSAGLGSQWRSKKERVVAQLDVGYVISGTDEFGIGTTEDGDVRGHFSLLVRY